MMIHNDPDMFLPVPHCSEELPEPILVHHALVLLVKASKSVTDDILWIGALKPLAKQGQKHGKVDGSGRVAHHVLQVILGRVLAQRRQHVVKVLLVDKAITVLKKIKLSMNKN